MITEEPALSPARKGGRTDVGQIQASRETKATTDWFAQQEFCAGPSKVCDSSLCKHKRGNEPAQIADAEAASEEARYRIEGYAATTV